MYKTFLDQIKIKKYYYTLKMITKVFLLHHTIV